MPEPSAFEDEMAIEKLKGHESPGIDQIAAELFKAGGRTSRYEIHKLIYIWNKEQLHEEWKGSIIVCAYKKGDKLYCNYRGISLLLSNYKILSNALISMLPAYAEDVIGDYQCGFRCNRSSTYNIFYIHEVLKKWEYN